MKTNNETPNYTALKKKIDQLGLVLPGRIRTTYQKCGTPTCKCNSGNTEDRHGPYTFWDRKVDGKLSSKSVSKQEERIIQKAIQNRKTLLDAVQQLLDVSANQFLSNK